MDHRRVEENMNGKDSVKPSSKGSWLHERKSQMVFNMEVKYQNHSPKIKRGYYSRYFK
jgi:hypothetical protein